MMPSRGAAAAASSEHVSSSAPSSSDRKPTTSQPSAPSTHRFSIPPPIKALFDRFPLHTYPCNPLPSPTVPLDTERNNLYLLLSPDSRLSPDPSHLKIQTYLTLLYVPHAAIPSQSPTPYLIPSTSCAPLNSTRLLNYAESHASHPFPPPPPHAALLTTTIETTLRASYLYALLAPATFTRVVRPAYINPLSTVWAVRELRAHELRAAWMAELARLTGAASVARIDETSLWDATLAALDALDAQVAAAPTSPTLEPPSRKRDRSGASRSRSPGLLGGGGPRKTLLHSEEWAYVDAVLFAYVHCVMEGFKLEGAETWAGRLWKAVKVREGLVGHWRGVRECVV